jgi:hypothetical protein
MGSLPMFDKDHRQDADATLFSRPMAFGRFYLA